VAGIGSRLLTGSYYGQTTQIWAALLMGALLAGFLIFIVGLVERVVNWRMGARA
jgi:NitT/TauT family transport system permease protein